MVKKQNNFKKNPNKNFEKKSTEIKNIKIKDINLDFKKEKVSLSGMVERVVQTGGPTIFSINDGTGNFSLKAFEGPGIRAHAEIDVGDAVRTVIKVEEFSNELEGDIIKIEKLNVKEKELFFKDLENIERQRAKPHNVDFLINDPILEKLKPYFIKAAEEIRLAIFQNRPIIVRHHNDADGYSSGYALERAILPLIEKQHSSSKAAWEYYTRAPCAAPFYEIDDSIRDTSRALSNVAKFSDKMPLVIIADNGSSPEDLMAIKQGKVHGMKFIVIDHHGFDEDVISKEVLVHINPFLVGEDGAKFSAGMLCTEFSRFINPVENISQIPAMAGLADRIDLMNPKAIDQYLKIAEKQGYSKKLLKDISNVIDYVSAKVRFMEVREYIEVLFGEPRDKQKELVDLLAPFIEKLDIKGLEIAKSSAQYEKIGKTTLSFVFVEDTFPGFGFFPKVGRSIGLLHDSIQSEQNITNLVTVGLMNTALTIRATDESNFSVHDLIKYLAEKIPTAFVEGGGHKNAGSISFIPRHKEDIFTSFKEFIKSRQ